MYYDDEPGMIAVCPLCGAETPSVNSLFELALGGSDGSVLQCPDCGELSPESDWTLNEPD